MTDLRRIFLDFYFYLIHLVEPVLLVVKVVGLLIVAVLFADQSDNFFGAVASSIRTF